MQEVLEALGPDVAGVILEPIQGEGGVNLPPAGYLAAVRALCDDAGALLVLDEVQTGLGRTGTLFACTAEGVTPDVLTLAKALGGGVAPIGACLLGERADSPQLALRHASTFAGNALACRLSLAFLDVLEADGFALLANVQARAAQLQAGHERIRARYPDLLAEVRGRGLLQGLRLAVSRAAFGRGFGTLIGALGEQHSLLPLFASHLLNVERIRTAPTLNHNPVLRIEPPLTVTAAECAFYLTAMERAVDVLASGDASALLGHLVGRPVLRGAPAIRPAHAPAPSTRPGDARFAFLIHPLDCASYVHFDASVRPFTEGEMQSMADRIAGQVRPFVHAATRVESRAGACAFGEFVAVPLTAEQMIRLPEAVAVGAVREAIDLARERGAEIVGLGGFTSIVMRGGTRALDAGVAITTGNSYTVVSAIQAVGQASRQLGLPLARSAAAVVGAAGAIGGALAGLLLGQMGRLVLIGSPQNPEKTRRRLAKALAPALPMALSGGTSGLAAALRRHPACPHEGAGPGAFAAFAERLLEENGARVPLARSVDLAAAIAGCPVVVTATSSTEELIAPDMLLPGAVVCDLSRPANASRRIAEERPDVLVIDGGVIAVPGRPDLGFDFGFPQGVGYACMAETMLLALERRFVHTSIGTSLDPRTLDEMGRLAARHGFGLAGLRSFDRPLAAVDWQRLRRARLAVPTLPDALVA
jgi:predicted amino acid dehydrogenase